MVADPVINFVAEAFFSMRGDLMMGGGALGLLSSFATFMWWLAAFALTLLPILYMIFFLPQTLPDEILRWLGGGMHSLGDSRAVTAAQAGMASIYGASGLSRAGGGGNPLAPKARAVDAGRKDDGGDNRKGDQALVGGQGVADSGGQPSNRK